MMSFVLRQVYFQVAKLEAVYTAMGEQTLDSSFVMDDYTYIKWSPNVVTFHLIFVLPYNAPLICHPECEQ